MDAFLENPMTGDKAVRVPGRCHRKARHPRKDSASVAEAVHERDTCAERSRSPGGGGTGFSRWGFVRAKTETHRLKSMCDNLISNRPAAKAGLMPNTLRHG